MFDVEGAMVKVGKNITEEIMGPIITDFQKDIICVMKDMTRLQSQVMLMESKMDTILTMLDRWDAQEHSE